MPFRKRNYHITEGWDYSEDEKKIHGKSNHGGVDLGVPRGTEVLAAAEGWAIASYFWKPMRNVDGSLRLYLGKEVGMGLGYFVQIYHPTEDLYVTYGHLDKFSQDIPFHRPVKRNHTFWPVGHKVKPQDLPGYKHARFVKKGEVLGVVGDSGLTWGYQDYPQRPDIHLYPSWDEPHLHFEVFRRVGSKGRKEYFDPFGIKADCNEYPDTSRLHNVKHMGTKSTVLWLTDQDGMLMFSR